MTTYSDLTEQVFRRALDRVRGTLPDELMLKLDDLFASGKLEANAILEAIRTSTGASTPDGDR